MSPGFFVSVILCAFAQGNHLPEASPFAAALGIDLAAGRAGICPDPIAGFQTNSICADGTGCVDKLTVLCSRPSQMTGTSYAVLNVSWHETNGILCPGGFFLQGFYPSAPGMTLTTALSTSLCRAQVFEPALPWIGEPVSVPWAMPGQIQCPEHYLLVGIQPSNQGGSIGDLSDIGSLLCALPTPGTCNVPAPRPHAVHINLDPMCDINSFHAGCSFLDTCEPGFVPMSTNANNAIVCRKLPSAYVLLRDGFYAFVPVDCYNANECSGSCTFADVNNGTGCHNCSSNGFCTDTFGSYTCTCKPGYGGDGYNCETLPYCNIPCGAGQAPNNFTCHDCPTWSANIADSYTAVCSLTQGNFNCGCPAGFRGTSGSAEYLRSHPCLPINECDEKTDTCPRVNGSRISGSKCEDLTPSPLNLNKRFACTCDIGFTDPTSSGVCVDVDECERSCDEQEKNEPVRNRCNNCDNAVSVCVNMVGKTAQCACIAGYVANNITGICEDINECAANPCNVVGAPTDSCLNLYNRSECMPIITSVTLLGASNRSAPFNLSTTSQSSPERVLITVKLPSSGVFWNKGFTYGASTISARAFEASCTSLNLTSFLCYMAPGGGANLMFSTYGCLEPQRTECFTVLFPAFPFSYPPPTLTSASLCTEGSCGTNIEVGKNKEVTMNGTNFLDAPDKAQVTFKSSTGSIYNCEITRIDFTSLSCLPDEVSGDSDFVFYVKIGPDVSGQTAVGSDRFSLTNANGAKVLKITPANPATSQCVSNGNATIDCPCLGMEEILVTADRDLPANTTCTVDDVVCEMFTFVTASTFTCMLPPGVGASRPVLLITNTSGPAAYLISYQGPIITKIYGSVCITSPTDPLVLLECPRAGGGTIYLEGKNFGNGGASILTNSQNLLAKHETSINGQPYDPDGFDKYLSFPLLPGFGIQNVVVYQRNGKISTTDVKYSYVACASGTIPVNLTCINCLPGTFATAGSATCTSCPRGYAQPKAGSGSCDICPSGRATNVEGMTNCTVCSPGTFAPTERSVSCTPCLIGFYTKLNESTKCFTCDLGRIANTTGLSSCRDCPNGTYSVDSVNCTECAVAKYAGSPGLSACDLCSSGKYQDSRGKSTCLSCALGTYTDSQTGYESCASCRAGSYARVNPPNPPECVACETGRYQNSSQPGCIDCPVGTFASATGSISCTPCETGYFMSSPGGRTCQPCKAGTYLPADILVKEICLPCLPGKHNLANGSSTCIDCPMGTYQAAPSSSYCDQCPAGKFSLTPGAITCNNCSKGSAQPLPGQFDCKECAAGQYAPNPGTAVCLSCSPGYYSDTQAAECIGCPYGSYQGDPGKSSCITCDVGTFSKVNASTCQLCVAGSFSTTRGASSCKLCSVGTSSLPGKTSCFPCGEGTYASNEGQPRCFQCPNGAHVDKYLVACLCPVGSYSVIGPATSGGTDNFTAYYCKECETGFVCQQQGLTADRLVEGPGYWRPPQAGNAQIYRCVNPSLCLGARQCRPNRVGPMCAVCQPGYKASGPAGACELCPADNGQTWGYTVGIVILIIFLLCIFYYVVLKVSSSQQIKLEKLAAMKDEQTIQEIEELQKEFAVDDAYFEAERAQFAAKNLGTNTPSETSEDIIPEQELSPEEDHRMVKAAHDRAVIAAQGPESYKNPIFLASGGGGRSSVAHIVRPGEKAMSDEIVNEGSTFRLKHLSMASRRAPNFMYKVKILVGFFQIASIMPLQGEIAWPTAYTAFISAFSILNFDFIPWQSLTCATKIDYFGRAMLVGCIPIVVVLALVLFFYVPMYIRDLDSITDQLRKQHKRNLRNRQFIRLLLFTVFLLYPFVSKVVLGVYNCITVERVSYLVADFELRCFDSNWSTYAGIAVIFVLLYPVGIPLIYYFILRRSYGHLHEPAVILQFGFLYEAYTDQRWYWELIDLVHKLILTSIVVFAPSSAILGVNMFIICAYMIMILLFHPYVRKGDDRFHLLTQTELFLLALVGYIIQAKKIVFVTDPDMDALLSACLILIVLFLVLSFIVIAGRNIQKIWIHAKAKKLAKQIQVESPKPVRVAAPRKEPETPKPRPAALEL